MTKKESAMILAVLKAAYPAFYRGMPDEEVMAAVNLWTEMFRDEAYSEVSSAVKALITTRTSGYPPTIGAVKEMLQKLHEPVRLTEQEAWAMVSKAASNGVYEAKAEFDKLPPDIQRVIGSSSTLRDWAMMDAETFQSVVASNFMRSYTAYHRRETEIAMMPADVKKIISGVSEKLALHE